MGLNEARRLFKAALSTIDKLGFALFAVSEADELGVNEAEERAKVQKLSQSAADYMQAFVRFDTKTSALIDAVDQAALELIADPFEIGYPESEPESEVFVREEIMRALAARIGAIHGLDESDCRSGLTRQQSHLVDICENIGNTIRHLVSKKVMETPTGEHPVKHVLFGAVKASFSDAVPDGGITFAGLTGSKPDLGIPRLKTCVETKVARTTADLAIVVDQLLADKSKYGSPDYTNFVAVIYTDNDAITDDLLRREEDARAERLNHEPNFTWTSVLVHGPLCKKAPKKVSL